MTSQLSRPTIDPAFRAKGGSSPRERAFGLATPKACGAWSSRRYGVRHSLRRSCGHKVGQKPDASPKTRLIRAMKLR